MRVKDVLGRFGEDLAVACLEHGGLTVIERNWRCDAGEIDVVAREGRTVVFVEVRTRSQPGFGDPAEAVSRAKAIRLRGLALRWLAEHPGRGRDEIRFDVVAVVRRGPGGTPAPGGAGGAAVRHIRGAF